MLERFAVHKVAKAYGRSPSEVREEWAWQDFCDALMIDRATTDAEATVRKHHEALTG